MFFFFSEGQGMALGIKHLRPKCKEQNSVDQRAHKKPSECVWQPFCNSRTGEAQTEFPGKPASQTGQIRELQLQVPNKAKRASERAQRAKVLAAKPDKLSFISGSYPVEAQNQLPQTVLCPPHVLRVTLPRWLWSVERVGFFCSRLVSAQGTGSPEGPSNSVFVLF